MRSLWRITLACFVLAFSGSAWADIIQLTSPTQLASGDYTVNFPDTPPAWLGDQLTTGGNTLTFIDTVSNGGFGICQAGPNCSNTGFPAGTIIAITGAPSSPGENFTIFFSQPVTQVGFYLWGEPAGDYYKIGGFTFPTTGLYTPVFLGLEATGSSTISSVFVQLFPDVDNIGIGPVTFGDPVIAASTPEPGTWVLMATGLAMLGMLYTRRPRLHAV